MHPTPGMSPLMARLHTAKHGPSEAGRAGTLGSWPDGTHQVSPVLLPGKGPARHRFLPGKTLARGLLSLPHLQAAARPLI